MTDNPDLRSRGFALWVDARQFPDAQDYWDANWLMIRAEMDADRARIRCDGPILMTTDIARFREQLAAMHEGLADEAALSGMEPELSVVLRGHSLGQIEGVIEITPDPLSQQHRVSVEADQSYLPALILSCDAILDRFPVINIDKLGR